MDEMLQELVDSRGAAMRVDRERSIIRGVKLLGLESRNGRKYLPDALAQAAALYEDAKVNVNHPKGHPLAARDYQDRLGLIRNVALRAGQGLFGDLHFNPKHTLAEQLLWDAEHAPENLGLSHNVQARTSRQGDQTVVEAILKVQSVDLVADPATTQGLFESASELAAMRAELDELRAREALRARRAAALALLQEHHLPDPDTSDAIGRAIVSEAFMSRLLEAPSDEAMRALVEERAAVVASARRWSTALAGAAQPVSREQVFRDTAAPADAAGFARAIT